MALNLLMIKLNLKYYVNSKSPAIFSRFYSFLTNHQVSAALRPFYFNVHPDRFNQYPKERTVNENSLKILNEYFDNLLSKRSKSGSIQVCFYLTKTHLNQLLTDRQDFKFLQFNLSYEQNVSDAIHKILSLCSLSTKSLDQFDLKKQAWKLKNQNSEKLVKFSGYKKELDAFWIKNYKINNFFENEYKHPILRPESLLNWLRLNIDCSKNKAKACKPFVEDIIRICQELKCDLKLADLCFESDWDASYLRGALISFKTLATQHSKDMHSLKGRKLIFRRNSGVNLQGTVILNIEDVRHNWINVLRSIKRYDQMLYSLPSTEAYLSSILKDITIVHAKFKPLMMIHDYLNQLEKLIKSLIYHKSMSGWPQEWPESLKEYKLVVDCDAGPLMLSPRGEFIVPASYPAQLIIDFITKNLANANELLINYKINKKKELQIINRCLNELEIELIEKNHNVTPDLMVKSCENILLNKEKLFIYFSGSKLKISNYYSVLHDGTLCIPYNWSL